MPKRKRYVKFARRHYNVGETVPVSAIYECVECENIQAFQQGEEFTLCEQCHEDTRWFRTNKMVHFVTKNLNTEFERVETLALKIADVIADYSGRLTFVVFHIIWFSVWIHANRGGSFFGVSDWDTYPYGLLTMIVSLEAIFLSTFILISQRTQSQKSELRSDLDYQRNINLEKDVAEVLSLLRELREEGKLLTKQTSEILEEANIMPSEQEQPAEKPKRKRKKRGKSAIEEAGIDLVHHE